MHLILANKITPTKTEIINKNSFFKTKFKKSSFSVSSTPAYLALIKNLLSSLQNGILIKKFKQPLNFLQ